MAVCLGRQLSKLAARISEPFVKCLQRLNNHTCIAKTRIARTNYLNLSYFCRKYTIFTKFYEFMIKKVIKFANHAVAVLVEQIMLFTPIMPKIITIHQSLVMASHNFVRLQRGGSRIFLRRGALFVFFGLLFFCTIPVV